MSAPYTISQLAGEFGVTPRTLRFYESHGLLAPERVGTRRLYAERDRVRLRLTLRGKRIGFSLAEIREIIDMYDPDRETQDDQLRLLLQRIRGHRQALLERQADLTATLAAMDDIESRCLEQLSGKHQQA
ncbi:MAG: MerR family DNA-binding transcriptional regulator [Gammaproteobacteria bacterium]|jgi:DNA-binding transcriptional MerR regulator|nr:MerR family DNA-binding transcriptional regulator [Gammaproteobacteria bacterium]